MTLRLKDLTLFEQLVLALSLVLIGFLLIDPFMLERSKALQPEARKVFRAITDIGRSNWMLIPTGAAIALALVLQKRDVGFRNAPAYGLIASAMGFVFVSVGGAGLIATLTKNILGRARPKLFDTMGPFEFKLFAFSPNYASLPSGHATNMFALATVIAILWPRAKVLAYTVAAWIAASRVLLGEHYVTDVVFGAILGTAVPYYVRDRFAARRWLFERTPQGGYRIRGARTRRWLGWQPPKSPFRETRLFGNSRRNSQQTGGE
jgi:membrane-associated phospholipid phosphatase